MSVGQPGALRLFIAPLSKEASWLLPFGLMSMGLLAAGTRPRWPLTQKHQALMLWGGWLATSAIFFSVAAFFHEYYLTMLAVPLAALVGIGVAELWRLRARHPWIAVALLMSTAIVTLGVQYATARAYVATIWWWPLVVGCGVLGALLLGFGAWQRRPQLMAGGVGAIMAALLITPGSWSVLTMLYPTANTSLPSAYSGNAERIATVDGPRVNQDLLAFLQANTQDVKYLMAVPSAMQGADYVVATGRPVLYLGGFLGTDPVVTTDQLARMVADGELRYIYTGGGPGRAGASDLSAWVQSNCVIVEGFDTVTQNAGTPDGTVPSMPGAAGPTGRNIGGRMLSISLYDCGQ